MSRRWNFWKTNNFIDGELTTLINRIIIDKGISKNTALKENIFALFNCIMNYIPIFICGKPVCSKTLSLELLRASLNGKESLDNLFKKIPSLNIELENIGFVFQKENCSYIRSFYCK